MKPSSNNWKRSVNSDDEFFSSAQTKDATKRLKKLLSKKPYPWAPKGGPDYGKMTVDALNSNTKK